MGSNRIKTLALGSSRIRARLERSGQVSALPPGYRTQPEPLGELGAQAGTKGDSTLVKQTRARANTQRCAVEDIEAEEMTEVGAISSHTNLFADDPKKDCRYTAAQNS